MPIHDWTRVSAGTYHNFHQGWTIAIRDALNAGVLPRGYYAMADQKVRGPEPDVVTLQSPAGGGGLALAPAPSARQVARRSRDRAVYARKANRLVIKDRPGRVVAMIEVMSPGNKDGTDAFNQFAEKVVDFLTAGVHVVLVDLFPPTARDPDGADRAVWERIGGEPFEPRPAGKPLTVVGFEAGDEMMAYSDPVAVGDTLPDAPLFLAPEFHVRTPLEQTYMASWAVLPQVIRDEVAPPA